MVLTDHLSPLRPRAEPEAAEVAAEGFAAQEADLRIEVVFERHAIDQHAVAVARVTEVAAIAVVLPFQPRRLRPRDVTGQIDVLEECERCRRRRTSGCHRYRWPQPTATCP